MYADRQTDSSHYFAHYLGRSNVVSSYYGYKAGVSIKVLRQNKRYQKSFSEALVLLITRSTAASGDDISSQQKAQWWKVLGTTHK